ncbi:hypothetical protein NHJ13051_001740 [Beauveria bassiana]
MVCPACWNGHVDVTRHTLDYRTEPNGNCQSRPPQNCCRRARSPADIGFPSNSKSLVRGYSLKQVIKDCVDKLEMEEYPRTDEP